MVANEVGLKWGWDFAGNWKMFGNHERDEKHEWCLTVHETEETERWNGNEGGVPSFVVGLTRRSFDGMRERALLTSDG